MLVTQTTVKCCDNNVYLFLHEAAKLYELTKDGHLIQDVYLGSADPIVQTFDVFSVTELVNHRFNHRNHYLGHRDIDFRKEATLCTMASSLFQMLTF